MEKLKKINEKKKTTKKDMERMKNRCHAYKYEDEANDLFTEVMTTLLSQKMLYESSNFHPLVAQSTGVVEYADCFSAEG